MFTSASTLPLTVIGSFTLPLMVSGATMFPAIDSPEGVVLRSMLLVFSEPKPPLVRKPPEVVSR
jgi:hypothetical protein